MKLFHGSNLDINEIDLSKCRPYKDFGKGFYLTELEDQAVKMAKRVARLYGGDPIVNVYAFDENTLSSSNLKTRDFGRTASEEWARFVMNNRSRTFNDTASLEFNLDNKYDIVTGPIIRNRFRGNRSN